MFYDRPRVVANLGKSALMCISQIDEQPSKRSHLERGDKSAAAMLKIARQLGLRISGHEAAEVFIDSPEGHSDMPKPIQRVKFTKAIARHTKIRDQNPSLGYDLPR